MEQNKRANSFMSLREPNRRHQPTGQSRVHRKRRRGPWRINFTVRRIVTNDRSTPRYISERQTCHPGWF